MTGAADSWPAATRHRQRCWRVGVQVATALYALVLTSTSGIARPSYFVAPLSGQRVSEYRVDLSVDRDLRQSYSIPTDCKAVTQSASDGTAFKGTIVDRRLWHKVENDCRYHAFLNRHPQLDLKDYVSDYDFRNARLDELAIGQHCLNGSVGGPECNWIGRDPTRAGVSLAKPMNDSAAPTCRLRNGVFYGRLYMTSAGIGCRPDAQQASLRLLPVDFADINGDHVLDAVLRLVPIGPGAVRVPLVLILTRNGPNQKLRRLTVDRLPAERQR